METPENRTHPPKPSSRIPLGALKYRRLHVAGGRSPRAFVSDHDKLEAKLRAVADKFQAGFNGGRRVAAPTSATCGKGAFAKTSHKRRGADRRPTAHRPSDRVAPCGRRSSA